MKKLQKITAIIISVIMLASLLCSCGNIVKTEKTSSGKVQTTDNLKDHVELTWYIRCSEPAGFDEVMVKANEYLKEKLNITLDLQCIEPGDYDQKVQLALASGENVDIIWTSSWANKYEPNVTKGAYLALDDYLELPELESLKNHYNDGIWTAAKVGGKIYGVPVEQVMYGQSGYSFITEISEKYNLVDRIRDMAWVDEDTHGTMEELEEIYDTVRAGEPDDFVITTGTAFNTFAPITSNVSGYYIVDNTIVDKYDEGFETAKRARRWNVKNYFPADIATLDNTDAYVNEAKVYSNYSRYLPGVEGKFKISKSYDVIVIPTSDSVIDRGGVQTTLNAISAGCTNPIRALKLLDFCLKDEYILNLLCYGIEGRDYTLIPDTDPQRMDRESGSYYIAEFMIGSQFLAYLVPSYEDDVWVQTKTENEAARVDDYIGFSFDPEPVESEISQCSAVTTEYSKIIGYGLEDPEIAYPEREEKLRLAGKQVVMDEIQRQLDEWLAEQE